MGKGIVSRAVTVEAISELGARVICEYPIQTGEVLELNCDFFKALEVKAPTMKVLNVKFDPEARIYRAQMIFVGTGEALLQKIRRWLYSHGGSNRPSL